MGFTLTDVLLFGGAKESDADNAAFVIMRRNILRWGAIGGYVSIVVHGVSPLVLPDAIANSLSYVKAFGGTEQSLQGGYTQLEYIESTGTQYIDTGVILNSEATITTVGQNLQDVGMSSGSPYSFWGFMGAASNIPRWGWAVYAGRWLAELNATLSTSAPYDKNKHTFVNTCYYDSRDVLVYDSLVDGVKIYNWQNVNNVAAYTSNTLSAYLFARNNNNTAGNFLSCRIFSYEIVQDGVKILNLVPCRRNSDSELGMYDLVSGTFFANAGTGDFAAGPTATPTPTPTPDAPVDIVSNNGVLKYGAIGKNLLNLNAPGVIYDNFINNDGIVTHDNTSTISDFIPCTEGTYYTAQAVALSSGSNLRIHGYDENKNWVQMLVKSPASANVVTTATCQIPAGIKYIKVCGYMMGRAGEDAMVELGDTATPYEPYMAGIYTDGTVETIKDSLNNTATAEMLLKVGDYQDVQSIIDGVVTRKVGVKVLDGTETFTVSSSGAMITQIPDVAIGATNNPINTHFALEESSTSIAAGKQRFGANGTRILSANYYMKPLTTMTAAQFKQWLTDQYAAGTPVIVVYPLATPTTESVAGQTLQVTDGDNTLEITQASLTGLELEAQYNAAVSLTIQEVQDANLDNNVTVTIQ